MSNDNVVKLIQPGVLTDRLSEVLRDGARALLTQAVEAEVSEFLAASADLTPADISDSAGAQMILDGVRKRWPWLKHLFADGAYDRTQLMDKAAFRDFTVQVVKRSDAAVGFQVIPRRWVVERTFAWMTRWRRLVRDYEERIDCSEAMIHVALGSVLLRRIAHE